MANLAAKDIAQAAVNAGFSAQKKPDRMPVGALVNATDNELSMAIAIATAESSGNPTITNRNSNGSTDYGLWQINSSHTEYAKNFTSGAWKDPATNARMAYGVYKSQGFKAWSVTHPTDILGYARLQVALPSARVAATEVAIQQVKQVPGEVASAVTGGGIGQWFAGALRPTLATVGVSVGAIVLLVLGVVILVSSSRTGKAVAGKVL